ncbi:MAG: hypothetical protein A2146_05850 [Actinobacteria bacterium RBG_16_67_10]|nr:MAG: hypothetical protein A2146_05850 [Actinobacteria bacterium RBG_16_67_10]
MPAWSDGFVTYSCRVARVMVASAGMPSTWKRRSATLMPGCQSACSVVRCPYLRSGFLLLTVVSSTALNGAESEVNSVRALPVLHGLPSKETATAAIRTIISEGQNAKCIAGRQFAGRAQPPFRELALSAPLLPVPVPVP